MLYFPSIKSIQLVSGFPFCLQVKTNFKLLDSLSTVDTIILRLRQGRIKVVGGPGPSLW